MSTQLHLASCALAIWVCFILYGVLQERIWHIAKDSDVDISNWLLLAESIVTVSVASGVLIKRKFFRQQSSGFSSLLTKKSFTLVISLCSAQFGSKYAASQSLRRVPYLVQALARSGKCIPAMLGSAFSGTYFSLIQWLSAGLVTFGTAVFSLGESRSSNKIMTPAGFGLMLLSLTLDGIVASRQVYLRKFMDGVQMMLVNSIGSLVIGIGFLLIKFCFFNPEELKNSLYFITNNSNLVRVIILYCLSTAFGQLFIFEVIYKYNPGVSSKITTVRKVLTVCASILFYGHSVSVLHGTGIAMVVASIFSELVSTKY